MGGEVEDITAALLLRIRLADLAERLDVEQLRGLLALAAIVAEQPRIAAPRAGAARW